MDYNNVEDNQFVGRLLESIRRSRNYTQIKVARELGIPQGTLSKIESGQLELSARLWHRFCLFMEVSLDTLVKGYFDECRKVPLPQKKMVGGRYRLLPHYGEECYWNVRSANPFILYEKFADRDGRFQVNLNRNKIPSSYFLSMDNPVNLSMLEDITPSLKNDLSKFKEFLKKEFQSHSFHGDFHEDYARSKHPLIAVKKYIGHSNKYACDYRRQVLEEEDNKLVLSYEVVAKKTLEHILKDYNKLFLENICAYASDSSKNIQINKKERDGLEIYEILVA